MRPGSQDFGGQSSEDGLRRRVFLFLLAMRASRANWATGSIAACLAPDVVGRRYGDPLRFGLRLHSFLCKKSCPSNDWPGTDSVPLSGPGPGGKARGGMISIWTTVDPSGFATGCSTSAGSSRRRELIPECTCQRDVVVESNQDRSERIAGRRQGARRRGIMGNPAVHS